jgi:uncharacterized protein YdhG (YjbR/CyaY superfamily)
MAAVEKYLAHVPAPARATLQAVRAAIRAAVPAEATEALSYQIPTFKFKGNLVAYGAWKNHCSLFPMSGRVMRAFANELKRFSTAKGTIRFPVDKPLPASLIKRLVRARLAEQRAKERSRA